MRFSVFAWLIAFAALRAPSACAGNHTPLADAKLTVLANGLRVITLEDHAAPLVAVDVWVRAGSCAQRQGESGAAHFLEHLLFKGTASRKPGEVDAAIEDLGATLGAGTTRDGAHFYTTVASQYLPTVLGVIADVLQNAALAPDEIERERAVILDEMAERQSDSTRTVVNALYARLAASSPCADPILGRPESLRTIPRETIAAFYRRLYVPGNARVVIVGDLPPDVSGEVAKAFGGWSSAAPVPAAEREAAAPPSQPILAAAAPRADGRITVAVGYLLPQARNTQDRCAAALAAELLTDTSVGRIPMVLRDNRPDEAAPDHARVAGSSQLTEAWLTDLTCDCAPLTGPSLLALYGASNPAQAARFPRIITDAVARLQRSPATAAEMEYARRRVIGRYLFQTETIGGKARSLGEWDLLGDYRLASAFLDGIRQMQPADIAAFAATALTNDRRADLLFVPGAR